MDNNEGPIKEYESFTSKLKEWYMFREKVGTEKTFGDMVQREENLEGLEKENMSKLEAIQKQIESLAKALGIEFDPETGEVRFNKKDENINNENQSNEEINNTQASKENIDGVQEELSRVKNEHGQITTALYGDENNKSNDTEKKGFVQNVNEKKQELMRRDVSAKKILQERFNIEKLKDEMDMEGARYTAQKQRQLMQLEQAKLELIKRIAGGSKENDMSVTILKEEISGLAQNMKEKEVQFQNGRAVRNSEFGMALNALEGANKAYELERVSGNLNKYTRTLNYSDDGILNGSELSGSNGGISFSEKELYDERGVMIFDVADLLSREKTINIDGISVCCVTEFGPGKNIEDSFYIGDSELVETNTNSKNSVEENPDVGKIIDETNSEEPTYINTNERDPKITKGFLIGGIWYGINSLSEVPEGQRRSVARALALLGGFEPGIGMNSESLAKIMCPKILEKSLEREEEIPMPGMPINGV